MKYELTINGELYDMAPFSFDIEKRMGNSSTPRQKFDFIKFVLGVEATNELLGKLDKCDPNDLAITFNTIVATYRRPLIEKTAEQAAESLEKIDFSKLEKLERLADKLC